MPTALVPHLMYLTIAVLFEWNLQGKRRGNFGRCVPVTLYVIFGYGRP